MGLKNARVIWSALLIAGMSLVVPSAGSASSGGAEISVPVVPMAEVTYFDATSGQNVVRTSKSRTMRAAIVLTSIAFSRNSTGYYSPAPGYQSWCFRDAPSGGTLTCAGQTQLAVAQCWWHGGGEGTTAPLWCRYQN